MRLRSVGEMALLAEDFVSGRESQERAVVIGLRGDLGSGKTTFVQCVAEALGIEEPVTSPTFVIQKTYRLEGQTFKRLVHIDAYRIQSANEMPALRWEETVSDPSNIVFIEWPENIEGALPEDAIMINFTYVDENTRNIVFRE